MPHIISTQFLKLIPLALIVVGLLSYNFMNAQWTGPTATAPGSNTEAPINVSSNYQVKLGDLGAVRMRAGQYCNADGTICFDPSSVTSGAGSLRDANCAHGESMTGIRADGSIVCSLPVFYWYAGKCMSSPGHQVTVAFCP